MAIKQRTWIMAYLVMDTPHDPNDPFALLLMDLIGQPMAVEEDLGQWWHLRGVGGYDHSGRTSSIKSAQFYNYS